MKSDNRGIVIDVDIPPYAMHSVQLEDQKYYYPIIEGYGLIQQVGAPCLPQRGYLIAIPPDAKVDLQVLFARSQIVPAGRILPTPEVTSILSTASSASSNLSSLLPHAIGVIGAKDAIDARDVPTQQTQWHEDPVIYERNCFFPEAVAQIGSGGYLRDQRFIQLLIQPVQYNPVAGMLRFTGHLKLLLSFKVPVAGGRQPRHLTVSRRPESAIVEQVLRRAILNYETGKIWRVPPKSRDDESRLMWETDQSSPAYKVIVDRDGIYRLSYKDLQAAGVPVRTVDPHTFRLFNRGREMAILVEGESDGQFDPEDAIVFYGQKANTKYTDSNVYSLTFGRESGRRMSERDGAPSGGSTPDSFKAMLHLERDLLYRPAIPVGEDDDYWFWDVWRAPGGPPLVFTAELKNVADGPFTAMLRTSVQGFTADSSIDPDHHLRVFLNGRLLQDIFWDGQTGKLAEIPFPQSLLVEGKNEIRLEAPGDTGAFSDQGLVNWFEIEYARRFVAVDDQLRFRFVGVQAWKFTLDGFTTNDVLILDISDGTNPKRLINFSTADDSSHRIQFQDSVASETEYLVAARTSLQRPVQIEEDKPSSLRSRMNGADYILITHRDFYNEVIPLARHRAAQGLRTLVVDVEDIYDEFSSGILTPEAIRDFLAYAYVNWQPPAPSYVLLVGDGHFDFKNNLETGERNFIPPFLAPVGFLPVIQETASDNRFVTVNGDDNLPDMFIGRLTVNTPEEARTVITKIVSYENALAESEWKKRLMFVADNPDSAGSFDVLSDIVADEHLSSSYEREKIYLGVPPHSTPAETKVALIAGINQGGLIVNYIGHSGIQLWAAERILEVGDLEELNNADRLPFVLSMSSIDGFFHFPGLPALSETLLRAESKGVIGWWGGTGGGFAAGHHIMNIGFFKAVFSDNITEIGPATTMGKLAVYELLPSFRNLVDNFVLLGDPAMKLALASIASIAMDATTR